MFVLSFKNGDDDRAIYSFDQFYMPLVEIKDSNVLINNKPICDQPVTNKQEVHDKKLLK